LFSRSFDPEASSDEALKHPKKSWNVQFFRSITSDSAEFDPSRTSMMNSKKGRVVDASIGQAYVQQIRNADRFIYVENQYFLGSAYCWLDNNDTNCNHTVPSEIAQKVVDKIAKRERFCAYICIPMFPEGDPSGMAGQEVLYWQIRTIEMMYKRVGEAIKQSGIDSHPLEWLQFFCPATREARGPWLDRLEKPTDDAAKLMRKTMRGPIYVHSKMMIVDDVYILVGSANINQRSMSGTRDTEMAAGCYQPEYADDHPFGEVHDFRMSLWTCLFRVADDDFRYPGSEQCIRKVRSYAKHNWEQYVGPEGSTTPGMMVAYPLNVLANGFVEYLPGFEEFPDFPAGSKVKGKKSGVLPQKLTT